ncbi:MAG TPA: DUF427 domain-containing protein [Euzebya sp.]|nr:DUF427 domain-containing protein [Euzebya sp.]
MATSSRGRVRVEESPRRVRVLLGGVFIADSTRAKYVWERPYYPTYYLPQDDVRTDLLVPTGERRRSPSRGDADLHTITAGGTEATAAAAWLTESPIEGLAGHIRLDFDAMDGWFEEDEQIYVHPRDPYSRVDVLQSSRRVRVDVDGTTVADSRQPRLLFETGLPTRYYLPKTDVRMDLLSPSTTTSRCPYKGTAEYYDVVIDGTSHPDLVWWYRYPTAESAAIAGYVCFYNEKVDLFVDGEALQRPGTPFS